MYWHSCHLIEKKKFDDRIEIKHQIRSFGETNEAKR